MSTRYDLIVGRENGEKTYWTKIGSAWPAKNGPGFSLTFDALPLPGKDGVCRVLMREPQERDAAPRQTGTAPRQQPRTIAEDVGEDIPF